MAPSAPPPAGPSKITPMDTTERQRRVEDDEVKPYVIVSDPGKGSFATVYRGYHEVCLLVHCHAVVFETDLVVCHGSM